jgi:hypothetical protein
MSQDPILKLRAFSTAQLIEELARRSNERGEQKPRDWCENCAHFTPWIEGRTPHAPMPVDYNPCAKRHVMRFQAPEDFDDEYGYYRTVCADRQAQTPEQGPDC